MALLSDLAMLRARVAASGSRLEKRRLVAEYLRELSPEDLPRALTAVAALALGGGAQALSAARPRVFVPLLPMLAEIAGDVGEALAAHGGVSAMEYKYDGARIQLHGDGERVAIWSRRLSEVTGSLPDIVDIARRDLGGAPFILDGEVVALDAAGRPLPFQKLMRRFRRVRGVEAAAGTMPLSLHLFDC